MSARMPYNPLGVGEERDIDGTVYTAVILRHDNAKSMLPMFHGSYCGLCPARDTRSRVEGCGYSLCGDPFSSGAQRDQYRNDGNVFVIVPKSAVPILALEGKLV